MRDSAFAVAEFFAGIGLMRMGLERHGGRVVFANDVDPKKLDMYARQFPEADGSFVLGDIHDLDPAGVPAVDLATASFPCTDLSLAGSRAGLVGAQSSAFWGFVDLLARTRYRPPMVLLENVPAFLASRGGADFAQAMKALNRLGYSMDPFVLDAAWFVPQSRPRLFVVGTLGLSGAPLEIRESRLRPKAVVSFVRTHPEIAWRARRMPEPPVGGSRLISVLEELPDDSPEWWSEERAEYLLGQMSARHRSAADQMIAARDVSYGTVFRRVRSGRSMAELRTDGLAGCLRTPKGGSGRQILVKCGGGRFRARLLTGRECARLMGADDYVLDGVPSNRALFGFGDAVCVPAVAWMAEHYLLPALSESRAAGVR